jgi:hypothetical protein
MSCDSKSLKSPSYLKINKLQIGTMGRNPLARLYQSPPNLWMRGITKKWRQLKEIIPSSGSQVNAPVTLRFEFVELAKVAEGIGHTPCISEFGGGLMKNNENFSNYYRMTVNPYDMKIGQRGWKPHIVIWESEIRYMAGVAARGGCIETGGEVYGLLSHAGRPVIMLANGPGPESIHEVAQFRQDIAFFQKVNVFLRNNFGLLYGGNFHSHHILGIKGPSRVDIRSINSIAQRNGFRRLVQFILTFEKKPGTGLHRINDRLPDRFCMNWPGESEAAGRYLSEIYARAMGRFRASRQANFIRIHSFLYLDAAHGEPVQCPIRIIPGTSPYRRAIMKNSIIPELAIPYSFPMSRILVDSIELQGETSKQEPEMPAWISQQCLHLPEKVRENARVVCREGLVVFSLSFIKGKVYVAFNAEPPYKVKCVYCSENGKGPVPIEIGPDALGFDHSMELTRIYDTVIRRVEGGGLAEGPGQPEEKGERVASEERKFNEEESYNGGED